MLTFMELLAVPIQLTKLIAESPYFFQREDSQDVRNWLTACEDYFDRNPTQWENHPRRIVFALGKTKGNKIAPLGGKYRKVMGGLGGYTRDPSYSTWERFRQEITKRYIGIEEERRALEKMNKVVYKGKIDTYLLLLENVNIKAGLTGIAWRVIVESGLPEEILRRLSHFKFANDEEWMETLQEVGRQEEELLKQRKLSRAITTPHTTTVKRKRDDTNKGFNTKIEKKGADGYTDTERKSYASRWKAVRSTSGQKTQIDSSKNEHANWNEADKGIPDDLVAKRKTETRCTRCHLLNHGWRKCQKEAVVATAFVNRKRQDRSKPRFKQRTSTLAVPPPWPQPPKPTAKVNQIQRLSPPMQVWELSDTEMSF